MANPFRWRLWAPRADSVDLFLFPGKEEQPEIPEEISETVSMKPERGGYFTCQKRDVPEGQRYAFSLNGGPPRPDPTSPWQPSGAGGPSAVLLPSSFEWSEGLWKGIPREALVIYELHVGTFTPQGTFEAIIPRLKELKDLGITAIEIMPVAQFPGGRNWGYDGVFLYAVQNTYGGPHGFRRLINACHQAGMAVILDVVYNHLGPEGNHLAEFGPYFTDRYKTPWGPALNYDDRGCDGVREFVLNNVRQWIGDYRLDGLRLDAVHAIYDFSARHILREIKRVADEEAARLGRPVHIIAESDLNDIRLLDHPERGGYGLDAQWSDDFHHAVHTVLTGERDGYYSDFGEPEQLAKVLNKTFVYDGCFSEHRGRSHGAPAGEHPGDRFVVAVQNHDQVGNRARGDRLGTLLDPAGERLAAGLLLLSPYLPLIFMGQEYGETRPFPFFCSFFDPRLVEAVRKGRREEFQSFNWRVEVPDPQGEGTFESAKLSWSWPGESPQAGLRRLYRDLLRARREWPALKDDQNRSAQLLESDPRALLQLARGELVALFNLSKKNQLLPMDHRWKANVLLSSEFPCYGGRLEDENLPPELLPHEFRVYGPGEWDWR